MDRIVPSAAQSRASCEATRTRVRERETLWSTSRQSFDACPSSPWKLQPKAVRMKSIRCFAVVVTPSHAPTMT